MALNCQQVSWQAPLQQLLCLALYPAKNFGQVMEKIFPELHPQNFALSLLVIISPEKDWELQQKVDPEKDLELQQRIDREKDLELHQ
jgi:hypothetical protein